jgi:ABC-type transporter Mla subunit MlaD
MKAQAFLRNVIVGFLFLGSLVVLGGASLLISTVSVFTQREALAIRFPGVDNLEPGDDVIYHGMRVGQVDSIKYRPAESLEKPVLVHCTVLKEVADRITDKTQIQISSKGPLGGRQVEITPPTRRGPTPSGWTSTRARRPGTSFAASRSLSRGTRGTSAMPSPRSRTRSPRSRARSRRSTPRRGPWVPSSRTRSSATR